MCEHMVKSEERCVQFCLSNPCCLHSSEPFNSKPVCTLATSIKKEASINTAAVLDYVFDFHTISRPSLYCLLCYKYRNVTNRCTVIKVGKKEWSKVKRAQNSQFKLQISAFIVVFISVSSNNNPKVSFLDPELTLQ